MNMLDQNPERLRKYFRHNDIKYAAYLISDMSPSG